MKKSTVAKGVQYCFVETCSSYGEVVAYFVFKGFESINDAQPKRLHGIEQTACSAYCTQNIVRCCSSNCPSFEIGRIYEFLDFNDESGS